MNKLSFDSFQERVNEITSQELLNTISGGTENACHDSNTPKEEKGALQTIFDAFIDGLTHK